MRTLHFTIKGRHIQLSDQQVREALHGVRPSTVRSWGVLVDDVEFPVKQALEVAAKVNQEKFVSTQAVILFVKWGFCVRWYPYED